MLANIQFNGLKIPWGSVPVPVRFWPRASHNNPIKKIFFAVIFLIPAFGTNHFSAFEKQ